MTSSRTAIASRGGSHRPPAPPRDGAVAPAVAVVAPCYNAEKWVGRTIASVLDEGYPGLELIVVDDGSTDRSAEIIAAFGDRLRFEASGNQGACAARNLGFSLSRATYVMFLDADDYVEDGLIGHMARALEETGADLAFGRFAGELPDGARTIYDHYTHGAIAADVFRDWLDDKWTPPCGVMWRAEFLREIGGWRSDLLMNQDGELMMRAMLAGPRLCSATEGLGVYNLHDEPSVSKIRTAPAFLSEIEALAALVERARDTPLEREFLGVQRRAYNLAAMAHLAGHPQVGDKALGLARSAGLKGHLGTLAHRLTCAMIGLKWKTRLAKALRRRRENLGRSRPKTGGY